MARKKDPDRFREQSAETDSPSVRDDAITPSDTSEPPIAEQADLNQPLDSITAAPTAIPVNPVADAGHHLEDRLSRLETTLLHLQQIEQRLLDLQNVPMAIPAPVPPTAIASSPSPTAPNTLLSNAASWIGAGVGLLPSIIARGDPVASRAPFSLTETIAELRSINRMFVDPRYSLSWLGRITPPLLLLAFIFSSYVVPFASVPVVGWLIEKLGQIIIGFGLFKVLGYEARRYREKAPDLPPSLRL
ncbi:MAG: hypothetical protein EBV06_01080 [Planctomycetia bacterium]|nr:hypothetical protein [Planctomycetia bacterium]